MAHHLSSLISRYAIFFAFFSYGISMSAIAQDGTFSIDSSQCEKSLNRINDPSIACAVPIRLTDAGRNTIKEQTFGVLRDVECDIEIRIVKRSIFGEIIGEDFIAIPPQLFSCIAMTNGDPLNIDFTVAPVVLMEENRARSASINMDNVSGVPEFVGNALTKLVNDNEQISGALVDGVNRGLDSLGGN